MEFERLQLTWPGKDRRPRLEPRILIEDSDRSFVNDVRREGDLFDNILIHGDNLLGLRAVEQSLTGKIKLVYIDPPYNTGNAFEHYDDGVEHSQWLSLMRERISLIHGLLSDDGFFCAHIDDSEGHYLKVMLDEIFGRSNYLTTIYVQVRYPQKTLKQDMAFHKQIEMVHVYRKTPSAKPNLPRREKSDDKFCYYVHEVGQGREEILGGKRTVIFDSESYVIKKGPPSEDGLKEIWATGSILDGNSSGRFFRDCLSGRVTRDGLGALYKVYGIGDDKFDYRYFTGPKRDGATKGKYFQGMPQSKRNDDQDEASPIDNFYDFAGAFGNCRHEGGVEFRSGKKPEVLLELLIDRFSNAGDIVLDSFAGSGTTGAVAHKMHRRWVMIELGDHCFTHIQPRLADVVAGRDNSGVTESQRWRGGGGFRYLQLAPSLMEKDRFDNWVISKHYDTKMLEEAMCKHFRFTYSPSTEHYWAHGYSSETDFIYVTTNSLTHEHIAAISAEVGSGRTLLICCKAFQGDNTDAFHNLTIKRIPGAILDRCEWGKDDYSLRIESLPLVENDQDVEQAGQSSLFDGHEGNER